MPLRLLAVVLLGTSLVAQAAPASDAQLIAGRAFVGGDAMHYLTELTDRFGPRLTGSPTYDAAAAWAVDQFHAMGIRDVQREPIQIAHTWTRGEGSGRILTPQERPLHLEALGWTPATPAGGIEGAIYVLDDISAEGIAKHAAGIRNHVVLIDTSKALADRDKSYAAFVRSMGATRRLFEAGAQAILRPGLMPSQVPVATSPSWDTDIAPLPVAFIGKEDADYIFRHARSGTVTVQYRYSVTIGGPATVNSVVAEIRGRERPDEWLLVGAHLDSWDFATGAQDNGTGSAQVLAAARILSSLGSAPRRSVRFALWTGEEQGLLGSRAYVKRHAAELAHCIAVLNTDNGGGTVEGWKVQGRTDLEKALQPFVDEFLAPLGAGTLSQEMTFDTDHGPFLAAGVPALDMLVDMRAYMELHHTPGDTLDKVKPMNLNVATAVLAMTANHLANGDRPLAAHLPRSAVETILRKSDIDALLKALGDW